MESFESFSPELILETIEIFKQEDNIELSPALANQYLHNMAGLFLAFAKESGCPIREEGRPDGMDHSI